MKKINPVPDIRLSEYIKQAGITHGPKKYELMREACRLMNVPVTCIDKEGKTIDPWYRVKFFDPSGGLTIYVQDYNPKTDRGWGLFDWHAREWGNFSLKELSEIKGLLGLGIEIDVLFTPTTTP
jgi:hypothetical protein